MYYILRRQEPQTCRILVNFLTTKETKPNKERVIPRHEEHHHLQGDPDGCQAPAARWAGQARCVRGDQGCDQVHQLEVDCLPRPPPRNQPTSPFQGYQINH